MAEVYPGTERVIAHLDVVRAAVLDAAREIGARADTLLAAHHNTGDATIEVTRGDTDAFVSLVDDAALSIEYGHFTPDGVTYVSGLYVITRAAGL